ncbi:FAD-dependent oxidoreductase, partial [Candidatus Bipolaricaulota bacterium]|nr:FAD-dependent oxidoreductase [Candidatus Bipolaricaulota bacterium]
GFVDDLVETNDAGEIVVDWDSKTNVEWLYAAGDVSNVPEKQIIIAAGEGAKAALGAYRYLIHQ